MHELICGLLSLSYVGVLYLIPRKIQNLPSDHPKQIWYKSAHVFLLCAISPFVVSFALQDQLNIENSKFDGSLQWMGIQWTRAISTVVWPMLITMNLFFGSMVYWILMAYYGYWRLELGLMFTAGFSRAYVVGPVTEEWIFRGIVVPVLLDKGYSYWNVVMYSPLLFGTAHLHHIVKFIQSGKPVASALMIVCFQWCYTTVFGIYACYIFMETKHLITVILIHAYCNMMSLPDFSYFNQSHPLYLYRHAISTCYIIGITAFIYTLPTVQSLP